MQSDFQVFIPARYGSTRLPGKLLADIAGSPMILHVVERCRKSAARDVVVATDNERIHRIVTEHGARAIMTSSDHASGTDRIAEATEHLGLDDDAVIVNVQGDEPEMPPELIDQVASALVQEPQCCMSTACTAITTESEFADSSVVKVVTDHRGFALYFSRSAIPFDRNSPVSDLSGLARRHLGIYGYRAGFVRKFSGWSACPLEAQEKLEQLRVLWHGGRILCVDTNIRPGIGVDTEQDLEAVRRNFSV